MARSALRDPLDKYRFTITIEGFTRSGFTGCSTPEYSIGSKTYAEGGSHLTPRKIVETVSYKPVTLTRGVTNDTSFNKWATGFIDLVQNNAATRNAKPSDTTSLLNALADNGAHSVPSNGGTLNTFSYRKDVKIEHFNRQGQVDVVYFLYNAFPISYKPASDFDSSADDAVSIETLTLDYESFEVKYTGVAGFAGNLATRGLLSFNK